MRQRQFRVGIERQLKQAVAEILGHNPYTTITALAKWAGVDYGTTRAWVQAEEEAGRLRVTEEARGYRVEVVK